MAFPEYAELGAVQSLASNLIAEAQAAAQMRIRRADQLAMDSSSMWAVALTSPTISSAMGYRTAVESGAGRTRLEANRPAETGAAAPLS